VHLDDPVVAVERVMRAGAAGGLVGLVSAGYGPEREATAAALIRPGRPLWRTVGLHPWWLASAPDDAARDAGLRWLEGACAAPGVVGVGEIGLDATRRKQLPIGAQRHYFVAGLKIARERGLPVVLHVVRWHGHALEALAAARPAGGVVHRYGGPAELVQGYVAHGLSISLCTDALRRPEHFAAVARAVPRDRLLVETDWPLDEQPYEVALGELRALVGMLAVWRREPVAGLARALCDNARRVFAVDEVEPGQTQAGRAPTEPE
jgi:TatD DNase family protein